MTLIFKAVNASKTVKVVLSQWFPVASDLDGGHRTRPSGGSVLPVTPGGKDGDVALIPADRLTSARGRG